MAANNTTTAISTPSTIAPSTSVNEDWPDHGTQERLVDNSDTERRSTKISESTFQNMAVNKVWLNVSLSNNLEEIKKTKILIKDEDYELAFLSLKKSCSNLAQEAASSSEHGQMKEFVMTYKRAIWLKEEEYFTLNDADDLEGMLNEYESGQGVRVIVKLEESKDLPSQTGDRAQDVSNTTGTTKGSSQNTGIESSTIRDQYSTLADNLRTAILDTDMETVESLCKDLEKSTLKIVLEEMELNDFGDTSLAVAAKVGDVEILKFLLNACPGADVMKVDNKGSCLLHLAVGSVPCLEYLIKELKIPIETRDHTNSTALHIAAYNDKLDGLKYLLAEGLGVESLGHRKRTPLLTAALGGGLQCMKYLLEEAGADLSKRDQVGLTALHVAAGSDRLDCMKYLLSRSDVYVDIESTEGTEALTPILAAAGRGSLQCVKYLLEEANADIGKSDRYGNKLMHYAVIGKKPEIVEYLLKQDDVEIEAKNSREKTALDIAIVNGDQAIITLLKNHNHPQHSVPVSKLLTIAGCDLKYTEYKLEKFEFDFSVREQASWRNIGSINLKVNKELYAHGGFRNVYLAFEENSENMYVVKRYNEVTKYKVLNVYKKTLIEHARQEAQKTAIASYFAEKFSKDSKTKFQYVDVFISEDTEPVFIEKFVTESTSQRFLRYVNNSGRIAKSNSSDEQKVCESFSHYTLQKSDGKLLVCDVQGWFPLMTDPEVAQLSWNQAGITNRTAGDWGNRAIEIFEEEHKCSDLCRKMKLSTLNCVSLSEGYSLSESENTSSANALFEG